MEKSRASRRCICSAASRIVPVAAKMYVAANNPKYFCRKCSNRIPIADLENIVRQELKVFFGQPERIASHLQTANQKSDREIRVA